MYTYNTSLISPYCDNGYYLSSKFCFNYIQEVAGRREMNMKTGIPHLLKENMSWVFLSTHVDIYKKPYWMTPLKLVTTGYHPESIIVKRRVKCTDDKDDLIFKSDSYFAVVSADGNKHHIINPSVVTDRNTDADPLEVAPDDFYPRFKKFNAANLHRISMKKYEILQSDCDINGHVNNLRYSAVMIDNLPGEDFSKGMDVCSMDILFSSEMHYGDIAEISIYIDKTSFDSSHPIYYASFDNCSFAKIQLGVIPKGETNL